MSKDLLLVDSKYMLITLRLSMEYLVKVVESTLSNPLYGQYTAKMERRYISEIDVLLEKINKELSKDVQGIDYEI